AQPLQRVPHAALHRVLVRARNLRDLAEWQARLLAQDEYLALIGRKREQRTLQERPEPFALGGLIGQGTRVGDAVEDGSARAFHRLPIDALGLAEAVAARAIGAEIPGNGVHPRLEARALLPGAGAL